MRFYEDRPPAWEPEEPAYHEYGAHGTSMIRAFAKSRRLYEIRYVTKTHPPKSNDTMRAGSMVELLVFDEDRFYNDFQMTHLERRGTKAWKEAEQAAVEDTGNPHVELVKDRDVRPLLECAARVREHPLARKIIEAPGLNQVAVRWPSVHGIECKVLIDRVFELADVFDDLEGPATVEFKFWRSCEPHQLRKHAWDQGLHLQVAQQAEGFAQEWGVRPVVNFVMVLCNLPTREVVCRPVSDLSLHLGAEAVDHALAGIATCQLSGDYRNPYELERDPLEPPDWVINEMRRKAREERRRDSE